MSLLLGPGWRPPGLGVRQQSVLHRTATEPHPDMRHHSRNTHVLPAILHTPTTQEAPSTRSSPCRAKTLAAEPPCVLLNVRVQKSCGRGWTS